MSKLKRILSVIALAAVTLGATAQGFSTGLDIYSSYIWRGAKFGSGPAFQPYVDYTTGGFSVGAWGSVNASSDEALEMDLYASYSVGPVSLTVTDYYFGGSFLDYSSEGGIHFIEPLIGVSLGDLSLTAAYMFGPGFESGDTYLEAAYSFGSFDLTLGLGDGAYTAYSETSTEMIDGEEMEVETAMGGDFMICNIGISTSKEIKISDDYSLPVSGAVTLNPATEGFYISVGVSF